MKILIVDDSQKWILFHSTAIKEIFGNSADIHTADSAKTGFDRILSSIDKPYDYIFTDMQMEPDFLPLFAGEWFIKQVKTFKEYKNTKIIAISAAGNLKQIAEKYNVEYIPKYSCNDLNSYCNKLLKDYPKS